MVPLALCEATEGDICLSAVGLRAVSIKWLQREVLLPFRRGNLYGRIGRGPDVAHQPIGRIWSYAQCELAVDRSRQQAR